MIIRTIWNRLCSNGCGLHCNHVQPTIVFSVAILWRWYVTGIGYCLHGSTLYWGEELFWKLLVRKVRNMSQHTGIIDTTPPTVITHRCTWGFHTDIKNHLPVQNTTNHVIYICILIPCYIDFRLFVLQMVTWLQYMLKLLVCSGIVMSKVFNVYFHHNVNATVSEVDGRKIYV